MKKIFYLFLVFLVGTTNLVGISPPPDCPYEILLNAVENNKPLKDFIFSDNANALEAFELVSKQAPDQSKIVTELTKVAQDFDEVKRLGYERWQSIEDIVSSVGDELKEALRIDLRASTNLTEKLKSHPELVDAWKVLQEVNSKSFIKNDIARLEIFQKLSADNQKLIRQFTDVDANSTLAKFLDDCDADLDFLNFVNNSDNATQVKGFLAHKDGMLTIDENRLLAEMLGNSDEIPNTKGRKWLEYGDNMAVFKANREAGNTFGNLIKTQLRDATSEAYEALKHQIPNLDDYSIYSQVQLCLKGDCISKGNYWIPDFVLVAERNGPAGKYLETIIADSKLSRGTGWTPNQKEANKLTNWSVKSISENSLIKGTDLKLKKDLNLLRNGDFVKIFNEGGTFKTAVK